jgi:hypothetical protein
MLTPIAIMSFNRPHFLAETLQSLVEQDRGEFEHREVHLFQDGAVNRWSRMRYAEQKDIDACIELFKAAFPKGRVHYTGDNIGICENFCRAEEHFFHDNDFPTAWFFEDDMILSPVYFRMMERLERYANSVPRVAYFSAYGNYYASQEEVAANLREIIPLDHHWAFGLQRDAWLRMRKGLEGYYALVRGKDYARRYHREIYDYFARSGSVPRGSSQDAAKSWVCARLGLLRLRTFAPFARYTGTQGAHMTQAKFDELGFAKTVIQTAEITDLKYPSEDGITEMLDEQRRLLVEISRNELPDIMSHLPARKYNPMRPCTEGDVVAAYQLLLNRNPETPELVERHVRETKVYTLVRGIIRSREFQDVLEGRAKPAKGGLPADRLCSEEELMAAYNLLMHRDPDRPAIEEREARGRTTTHVVRDISSSGEFSEIASRIQHPW